MFVLNISFRGHMRQHTIDISYYDIGPKALETITWRVALLLNKDINTCSAFNMFSRKMW